MGTIGLQIDADAAATGPARRTGVGAGAAMGGIGPEIDARTAAAGRLGGATRWRAAAGAAGNLTGRADAAAVDAVLAAGTAGCTVAAVLGIAPRVDAAIRRTTQLARPAAAAVLRTARQCATAGLPPGVADARAAVAVAAGRAGVAACAAVGIAGDRVDTVIRDGLAAAADLAPDAGVRGITDAAVLRRNPRIAVGRRMRRIRGTARRGPHRVRERGRGRAADGKGRAAGSEADIEAVGAIECRAEARRHPSGPTRRDAARPRRLQVCVAVPAVLITGQRRADPVATLLIGSAARPADPAIEEIRLQIDAAAITGDEGIQTSAEAGGGIAHPSNQAARRFGVGQAAALTGHRIADALQTAEDLLAFLQQRIADALTGDVVDRPQLRGRTHRPTYAGARLLIRTALRFKPHDAIEVAVVRGADELRSAARQLPRQMRLGGRGATLAPAEATLKAGQVVLKLRLFRASVVGGIAGRELEPRH
jgi:hypothetical protein